MNKFRQDFFDRKHTDRTDLLFWKEFILFWKKQFMSGIKRFKFEKIPVHTISFLFLIRFSSAQYERFSFRMFIQIQHLPIFWFNCSAWLRLKLNTKIGLNHHTPLHPTTLHYKIPLSSYYSDNFKFHKFLKNAEPTLDQIHIFFQIEKIGWRLFLSERDVKRHVSSEKGILGPY